jgi:hypothetical protein
MGFEPAGQDQLVFVVVTGYPGRQEANLAPPSQPTEVSAPEFSPAFTVSLFDWLETNILNPSSVLAEVLR